MLAIIFPEQVAPHRPSLWSLYPLHDRGRAALMSHTAFSKKLKKKPCIFVCYRIMAKIENMAEDICMFNNNRCHPSSSLLLSLPPNMSKMRLDIALPTGRWSSWTFHLHQHLDVVSSASWSIDYNMNTKMMTLSGKTTWCTQTTCPKPQAVLARYKYSSTSTFASKNRFVDVLLLWPVSLSSS